MLANKLCEALIMDLSAYIGKWGSCQASVIGHIKSYKEICPNTVNFSNGMERSGMELLKLTRAIGAQYFLSLASR